MNVLFLSTCALLAFAVCGQFFRRTEAPALAAGVVGGILLFINTATNGESPWFYLLDGAALGLFLGSLVRVMKTRKAAIQ